MTQTRFKKIPFNLELAKKITNHEIKGQIVTMDGRKARIICFDRRSTGYPIAALVITHGGEDLHSFSEGGCFFTHHVHALDLHIELPTDYKDYSNFKPSKWQKCLVRDFVENSWGVLVCAGKNSVGNVVFYGANGKMLYAYRYYLPLSKETERLIGTTKSYEELIQEIYAESTKNEQQ